MSKKQKNMIKQSDKLDLSVIVPSFEEQDNLFSLLPKILKYVAACTSNFEIIVIEGAVNKPTEKLCKQYGVKCIQQKSPGFGNALKEGITVSLGDWIIIMDADGSHNPAYIPLLWEKRVSADLVIASRYVPGGFSEQNYFRSLMSRMLNSAARFILDIPFREVSGGYKLYRKSIFKEFELDCEDFNIQIEVVVKAYAFGFKVTEIPFHFDDRIAGKSKAKIFKYGFSFMRSIFKLWRMRNTVYFADYDLRAFQSRLLPQRIWHHERYNITASLMESVDSTLEVGCGTGRMFFGHPNHIGVDLDFRKIRFLQQFNYSVINADATALPFANESFQQVICQEVIEHSPDASEILKELRRVLKFEGILVLSTPDYSKNSFWPPIEKIYAKIMPNAYAEEHITHYTEDSLCSELENIGMKVITVKKAFKSILHVKAVKK